MNPAYLTAIGGVVAAVLGALGKRGAQRRLAGRDRNEAPEQIADAATKVVDLFERAAARQDHDIEVVRRQNGVLAADLEAVKGELAAEQTRCRGIEREVRALRARLDEGGAL